MLNLEFLAVWAVASYRRLRGQEADRGDVPGWVMVTVMTAGLVVVIFAAFSGKIKDAITAALNEGTNTTDGTK